MDLEAAIVRVKQLDHWMASGELPSGVSKGTLYRWKAAVKGRPRTEWAAILSPKQRGRTAQADICDGAWNYITTDWLRLEQPTVAAVYRRAQRLAAKEGWELPSVDTVRRRLQGLPEDVITLARQGKRALERLTPYQQRSHFDEANEAWNLDGHQLDVWVQWPDGEIIRPVLIAIQDFHSRKLLAMEPAKTENKEATRLAFAHAIDTFGVPDILYLDNGRAFNSKWLTGRSPSRFRFQIKDEEPMGILTGLGIQIKPVKPHRGESKPIERAFRDFCEEFARHPACAGCYAGNSPVTRPDYGVGKKPKAISYDTMMSLLDDVVTELNARTGRRGEGLNGQSYDQVFNETYAGRVAGGRQPELAEWQRASLYMASEAVKVKGWEVKFAGNVFIADELIEHSGKKIILRFDPENLQETAWAYTLSGDFIGPVACQQKTGFADQAAAQEHARLDAKRRRETKRLLDTIRRQSALAPVTDPYLVSPNKRRKASAAIAQIAEELNAPERDDLEREDRIGNAMIAASRRTG